MSGVSPASSEGAPPHQVEAGVRAILLYKYIKGGVELGVAAVLILLLACNETEGLHRLADHLRHHVTAPWSTKLADVILAGSSHRGVQLTALALFLDGVLTSVEGWALHTGKAWGKWLIVVASGALLPLEAKEIVAHHHAARIVVFLLNLSIVVYLARKALRETRDGSTRNAQPIHIDPAK